jgi:hypothetical protein
VVNWEVDNFFNNSNIFVLESLSSWNPLSVDLSLELSLGWFDGSSVSHEISLDVSSEILVSLSSSSPFVGNLKWSLELDVSWMSIGSWGEFGLSNLVVPGSSVHILNSLASSFPVSSFFLKLSSGTGGVFHVFLEGLLYLEVELVSLVDVIVNLSSDQFSFLLLNISNERFWLWFWKDSNGFVEIDASLFVSLEFLWPFSFSGSFESSFISGNRFLVVNPIILEILVVLDISEFGIRIVLDDLVLVGNLEVDITRFVSDEFEVL